MSSQPTRPGACRRRLRNGYAPARRGGAQQQQRGRPRPGAPRGLVRRVDPGRRAAAALRAHRGRALEPDLPRRRRGRRALDPAPPAARHQARLRARHGPRAPDPDRARGQRRARAAPARALRRRVGHGRRVLRHGARRRARAARRGRRGGRLRRGRAGGASREALVDTLADLHAVDPDAAGLGELGRRDGYAERQLKRWKRQWEASKTRELDVDGGDPPAAVRARARAGRDLARARRLPPGQRDRLAARARSRPCSTGSCARSATRSPTSAS